VLGLDDEVLTIAMGLLSGWHSGFCWFAQLQILEQFACHAGGAVKLGCLKLLSMFRVFATFYTLVECTSDLSKYEKASGIKVHHKELAVKVTNFVVKFLVLFKIIFSLVMSVVECKLINF
jgi:hypothetical protein